MLLQCGDGIKSRTRTCSDPEPKYDGEPCKGDSTERKACKLPECPGILVYKNIKIF